mgnify:CR=1 FL=1
MSKKALKAIEKKFKAVILDSHDRCGDETVIVRPEGLRELCLYLKHDDKMAFDYMNDITAVDYLERKPRFEVVYHLMSLKHRHRIRIKVPLEEGALVVDSVHDVWRAANWGEREVWDMYGIRFRNHPDLRRILMYEEFEGHPLRKDYPIQKSQPRMDLRARERDAVEEYHQIYRANQSPRDTAAGGASEPTT